MIPGRYVGRFAPSPTGPLHMGSLVAALASWLDARAHRGQWLIRIEDVDTGRCLPGMGEHMLQQLAAFGLISSGPVLWQSQRSAIYQSALDQLDAQGLIYGCQCSRKSIEAHWAALGESGQRHGELRYPGTCRQAALKWQQHATRFHLGLMINFGAVPSANIDFFAMNSEACRLGDMTFHAGPFVVWEDRRLGIQSQNAGHEVGDFVLRRADGTWAYQLAVVADDAAQGVTHVVRGEDLASNTARQIMLQRALNLPSVSYLHTPLVLAADGQKLSKQNGAQPLELGQASATLREALRFLGLQVENTHASVPDLLHAATQQWAQRFCIQPAPSSLTGC